MTFIKKIAEKNQFPIIFIGSGITQRYFKNAPTWEGLLKMIWCEIFDEEDFYAKIHEFEATESSNFDTYLRMADFLEIEVDRAFWKRDLRIPELSLQEAHEKKISPFKQLIASKFKTLELKDGVSNEISMFTKMLSKARIIITTNYDTFIEDCLQNNNTRVKINIGNKGLFSKSSDYGELYKIHGSVTDVNTISITTADYASNRERSAIVNAKILSNLVESPILFLGYSLTDENIRKLLDDFSKNSPYDIVESSEKIGVVEYAKGENNVINIIGNIADSSVHYTQLRTDNFEEIYQSISKIDQGFSPAEISKFEQAFRKIIKVKGESKGLKTVLTTYLDLSKLSDNEIKEKNIVVAFGDGYYIYKFPDMLSYVKEYFKEKGDMPEEIAIDFISKQPKNAVFPYKNYIPIMKDLVRSSSSDKRIKNIQDKIDLSEKFNYLTEKENIAKRVSKKHFSSLDACLTISQILELKQVPLQQQHTYIASHLEKFSDEELLDFIRMSLEKMSSMTTDFRRILKMYDNLER